MLGVSSWERSPILSRQGPSLGLQTMVGQQTAMPLGGAVQTVEWDSAAEQRRADRRWTEQREQQILAFGLGGHLK